MTAEIAILNREAVALAADSAVTFQDLRGRKIFQSANKIFALSKYHPVGIMVYGDALFMDIPWETVVKLYRRHLRHRSFTTLADYGADFLKFLCEEPRLNNPDVQQDYVRRVVTVNYLRIKSEIDEAVKALLAVQEQVTEAEIKKVAKKIVRTHHDRWHNTELPAHFPPTIRDRVKQLFFSSISQIRDEVFPGLLTAASSRWLGDIGIDVVLKFPTDRVEGGTSGVVIAGYGDTDVFPALISYFIDAVLDTHLKYADHSSATVTHGSAAVVKPFAQSEMVYMFMEGIDPEYRATVEVFTLAVLLEYPELMLKYLPLAQDADLDRFKKILRRAATAMFRKYSKELGLHRARTYAQPIVRVISMLPKEELASAAESLVTITSVKRRFSMQAETVGGPIDVAVISKGDGFIWIKRKHYFDPRLNPHFAANYFREASGGEETSRT